MLNVLAIEVNAITPKHGYAMLKKDDQTHLNVDSYVFETNVHFPTDLNLAWDSSRKCIKLTSKLFQKYGLNGWRKHESWRKRIKTQALICARAYRSGGKNKELRVRLWLPHT